LYIVCPFFQKNNLYNFQDPDKC